MQQLDVLVNLKNNPTEKEEKPDLYLTLFA